jgi:putative oxidoreductase
MVRFAGVGLSLLRIVAGLLYLCHGGQKVLGWFGGMGAGGGGPLPPLIMAAGWIELIGGTLILLGLFTHIAAFICSGEMAFAYFMSHFPRGFWPIQNHGDIVVMFCFTFLYLSVRGAGPFSLDALIWRSKAAEI